MSKGVNKVILVGNLGKDPELIDTKGTKIVNISIATSESWKGDDGAPQERTEWHKLVFFGRQAEIAAEYLRKGSKIYVEGKLRTEKYQKDGQDHYATKIIVSSMQMLDSKSSSDDKPSYSAVKSGDTVPQASSDFDDDVPF
jgi:single-strand DNA-binding protein